MKKVMLASLSLSLVASLAACSGNDESGPASESASDSDSIAVGEVSGTELVVHEAIALRVDGPNAHGVAVVLTDRPGACPAVKGEVALPSAHTLTLFVPDGTVGDQQVAPSSRRAAFTDWNGGAEASFGGVTLEATDGSIDLAADLASGGRSTGTFDLRFGGDVLVGKFAAVYCDATASSADPLSDTEKGST